MAFIHDTQFRAGNSRRRVRFCHLLSLIFFPLSTRHALGPELQGAVVVGAILKLKVPPVVGGTPQRLCPPRACCLLRCNPTLARGYRLVRLPTGHACDVVAPGDAVFVVGGAAFNDLVALPLRLGVDEIEELWECFKPIGWNVLWWIERHEGRGLDVDLGAKDV